MKPSILREQTDDELAQVLREKTDELFSLAVKKATGDSSVQPLRRRTLRRDIARVKTEIHMRQKAVQHG